MQNCYKFRLYPTKQQEQSLINTIDKCRFIYNKYIEKLRQEGNIKFLELQHYGVELKKEFPELKEIYSKALQYESYHLLSNLRGLFKLKENGKKVGSMRFKGRNWFKTFTYNQRGYKIIKENKRYDKLYLSKIGEIPFVMHQDVEGKIKQVTIKKHPSGKWYASIFVDANKPIKPTINKDRIGIDLGLTNYIYDSKGNSMASPKYLIKSSKKLERAHKRLTNKIKFSSNREKAKIKLAKIHEKIVNQRNDFLHKVSRYYVNSYGLIAVENLKVRNMKRNHYLARVIDDASWSRFIQMLCYKAERAGCTLKKVEPNGTTQVCSDCGIKVPKKLWNRLHKCRCGIELNRDHNSAKEILKRALIGQELSKSKPKKIALTAELKDENYELSINELGSQEIIGSSRRKVEI